MDKSLNELLAERGYTTQKANNFWGAYAHHIVDIKSGTTVFTGDSYQVSAWLKEQDPSIVTSPLN